MSKTLKRNETAKFDIGAVIRSLLLKYVDWERMWYNPKNKFKKGDKIKLNWKAWATEYHQLTPMTFKSIDSDNVVDTYEGDTWNLYWLTRG